MRCHGCGACMMLVLMLTYNSRIRSSNTSCRSIYLIVDKPNNPIFDLFLPSCQRIKVCTCFALLCFALLCFDLILFYGCTKNHTITVVCDEQVQDALKAFRGEPSDAGERFIVFGYSNPNTLTAVAQGDGGLAAAAEHLVEDDARYGTLSCFLNSISISTSIHLERFFVVFR